MQEYDDVGVTLTFEGKKYPLTSEFKPTVVLVARSGESVLCFRSPVPAPSPDEAQVPRDQTVQLAISGVEVRQETDECGWLCYR